MLIRPRGFGIRKKISNPSIFSIFFKFSNFFLMKKLSCRRSRINKVQNASRKKKKIQSCSEKCAEQNCKCTEI